MVLKEWFIEIMSQIVMIRSNYVDPDSRVEKEANSLVMAGHKVILLTWNRSANYKCKIDKKKLQDTVITRVSCGAQASFGEGMKNLGAYLKFQKFIFCWLIKHRNEYDVCHCCDFDTANVGSLACKIVNRKYIFDIFDYISTDAHTLFQKVVECRENSIVNHAKATIICTEQRKKQIEKCKPNNLTIIHNSPAVIPQIVKENNSSKKIKIAYVGILMEGRLLKEMAEVVANFPNVELHIGGFGKYEDFMRNMALKYDNIFFYGKIPYNETLKLEQECDLMTAIYDPMIGNHKYAAPNKFYEALYLGKPLIMVKGTGMSDIIEREQIGVLIDYSKQGFENGIKKLIERQENWKDMSDKMKILYSEHYSWKEMERRLIELYKKISL